MSDLQFAALGVGLPPLCDTTEQTPVPFICSVGYKGLTKHTNTWRVSGERITVSVTYTGIPKSSLMSLHLNDKKMLRSVCLVGISLLLLNNSEIRDGIVSQRQSVAAEKLAFWRAQLCVGVKGQLNHEPLNTMPSVHQMGVCSEPHKRASGRKLNISLLCFDLP